MDSFSAVSDRCGSDAIIQNTQVVPGMCFDKNKRHELIASKMFLKKMEHVYRLTTLFAGLDILKNATFIKRRPPTSECVVGILSVFAPGTSFVDVSMYMQVSEISQEPVSGWTFRENNNDVVVSVPHSHIESTDPLYISVVGEFRSTLLIVSGMLPDNEVPNPLIESVSVIVPFCDADVRDAWARTVKLNDSFRMSVGWYEDPTGFLVPTCLFER